MPFTFLNQWKRYRCKHGALLQCPQDFWHFLSTCLFFPQYLINLSQLSDISSHGVVAGAIASTIGAGVTSTGAAKKQVHESDKFL